MPGHFKLPLTLTPDGDLALLEQDTPAELVQRVRALVCTPYGHVDLAPDFGLHNQAHRAGGADLVEIERQLSTYVPDADTMVAEDLSRMDEALDLIGVQVASR